MALALRSSLKSFLGSSRRSGEEIYQDFQATLHQHASMTNPLNVERRGLIDYENSPFHNGNNLRVLSPIDRIRVDELQLRKDHNGRFILCRIVSGSYQLASVCTLIKDPTGAVERLSLTSWSDYGRPEAWNLATRRFIPIGTIIAVRNPSYTVGPDGHTLIRCENPLNVVIIPNNHPLLEGILWTGGELQDLGLVFKIPSKLKRFGLRSEQLLNVRSDSGRLHLLCTPPRTTNLLERVDAARKCKKRRQERREKRRRDESFAMAVRRKSLNTLSRDGNAVLISCFLVFIWYVFFL